MSQLQVTLFKNGRSDFFTLLRENDITFRERQPTPGIVMNAGDIIEIINAAGAATPFGAVAVVIVTWLRSRASREVIIQTKDKAIFTLKGYSAKEAEEILEKAVSVHAIQTENDSE